MLRWKRAGDEAEPVIEGEPAGDELLDHVEVVERLRDGVLLITADGLVGWLNGAARRLLGAPENAVGRPLIEVVRDHRLDALVRQAREAGSEQVVEFSQPVSGRTLRGRAMPLSASPAACLILEDVSRLRYLETVRQQFVANLSHELRTPLAGLDLAAQTLAGQLPDEGPNTMFMERILQESARLNAIVQNLTQLAALDAEQIQVEQRTFSVLELLDENAERYAVRAAAAGLQLRVERQQDDLSAFGDRAKTDQALQSLVDNALKFTNAGEVVLSAAPAGEMVEVVVRDTGIGIPAQDLPRIFERFYKVDRARAGQLAGSGLGLSIARHLVELQRGTLAAESTPGSGTTMRIRLPRAPFAAP
jgi:two-component system, OmpR family, phosphate regulon sensor histidine kinase PhoR